MRSDVANAEERETYAKKEAEWEEKTADLRTQIDALEKPREKAAEEAIAKFPQETQAILRKPENERTP